MEWQRHLASLAVATTVIFAAAAPGAEAQTPSQVDAGCDHACLATVMSRFIEAMTQGEADAVPLAQHAEVRENGKVVGLERTVWAQVKAVRSTMSFADPLSGNVVARAGVEFADGKPQGSGGGPVDSAPRCRRHSGCTRGSAPAGPARSRAS